MNINNLKIIFTLILFTACIPAQSVLNGTDSKAQDTVFYYGDYSVIVDTIEIRGNETTKDFVILRELTFGIGDTLTLQLASYNRERIYSLRIFNDVKLVPYSYNDKNILRIDIVESWYIYPVPFITLKDKDWNKISYGISTSLLNFRGRNETLRGVIAFGYDPSFSFYYLNPNLAYNENLYLQTILSYSKVTSKSETADVLHGSSFEQKNFTSRFIFGKRFGKFHHLSLTTGFDYVETPFYLKGINASSDRIDRTLIVGASYLYDTRDLIQYAKNGIYGFVNFEMKGFGLNNISYYVADLDFREYRSFFNKLTAKWRFSLRHTNGDIVPYYDYSFLGFNERIRGYFYDEQREGNDRIISSVELNYPLIEETRINLYFVPVLPRSLLSYRVALIAELFADTGTTRNTGEAISIKDFDSGYGTGLSVLFLPYAIFRLEMAISDRGNTEWIVDLGVSF